MFVDHVVAVGLFVVFLGAGVSLLVVLRKLRSWSFMLLLALEWALLASALYFASTPGMDELSSVFYRVLWAAAVVFGGLGLIVRWVEARAAAHEAFQQRMRRPEPPPASPRPVPAPYGLPPRPEISDMPFRDWDTYC